MRNQDFQESCDLPKVTKLVDIGKGIQTQISLVQSWWACPYPVLSS